MLTVHKIKIRVHEWLVSVPDQFRHLDARDPSSWPPLPRYCVFLGLTISCVVALWFLWLSASMDELTAAQAKELQLRDDYRNKLAKAVSLDVLKKQREQVQQYVTQLEKQLPSKAEMDALLADINQAGLGHSLQFDLFRPGPVVLRDYYAEQPIALRVTGRYHDIGYFASDIANLSRIVTLNNVSILPAREGALAMEATAKTFRYLDQDERKTQVKAAPPPASAAPPAKKP